MTTRTRNRKKISILWNYFEKNDEDKVALCSICRKSISYRSTTTNLKQHLRLKHYKAYEEFLTSEITSKGNTSTDDTSQYIIDSQEETETDRYQKEDNKNKSNVYLKDVNLLVRRDTEEKKRSRVEERRQEILRPKHRRFLQHDHEEISYRPPKTQWNSNGLDGDIDGDKHFALSIVPVLKQLSDEDKFTAKMSILKVLQELRSASTSNQSNHKIIFMAEGSLDNKGDYLEDSDATN